MNPLSKHRTPPGGGLLVKYVLAGEVKRFLDQVKATKKSSFKSVGEGDDIRFEGGKVNGFALVNRDEIIHLAAFAE